MKGPSLTNRRCPGSEKCQPPFDRESLHPHPRGITRACKLTAKMSPIIAGHFPEVLFLDRSWLPITSKVSALGVAAARSEWYVFESLAQDGSR